LLFWKIVKIVATRCQILTLKCTKINFGWGSAPDPTGRNYSATPDPLAGFKGAYFSGEVGGAWPLCFVVLIILVTGLFVHPDVIKYFWLQTFAIRFCAFEQLLCAASSVYAKLLNTVCI